MANLANQKTTLENAKITINFIAQEYVYEDLVGTVNFLDRAEGRDRLTYGDQFVTVSFPRNALYNDDLEEHLLEWYRSESDGYSEDTDLYVTIETEDGRFINFVDCSYVNMKRQSDRPKRDKHLGTDFTFMSGIMLGPTNEQVLKLKFEKIGL
jgi:hypothetical protein